MRVNSMGFAGYRSFAARSPAAPDRPLERLDLAPLTVLLGKNNSGKSNAARLLHHLLLALGHDGADPFPLAGARRRYAESFHELQHNGDFFNPLDLEVDLQEGSERVQLTAKLQLAAPGDDQPTLQQLGFSGDPEAGVRHPGRGLLPDVPAAVSWREGARRLLAGSCHLGPIRDSVQRVYVVRGGKETPLLDSPEEIAQLLLADPELRKAVGEWTEQHLEGWRVDVRQNLDVFQLLIRRRDRESNLAAAGQGLHQVLPLLVLCNWRRLGRSKGAFLDLVEQPELHLHDAAHAALGDLLLSAVRGGGGCMVVETHSESLVLRLRRRVAEGSLSPDQLSLYYVQDLDEGSRLRPIPLDSLGEVGWWPEGVFAETFEEVKAIRRAQRARGAL